MRLGIFYIQYAYIFYFKESKENCISLIIKMLLIFRDKITGFNTIFG